MIPDRVITQEMQDLQRGAGGISVQDMEHLCRQITVRLVVSYGDSLPVADISQCVLDTALVLASTVHKAELPAAVEQLARSRLRRKVTQQRPGD